MELDWCGIAYLINTMTYRPKLSVIMLGQYHFDSVVALETEIFCFFILFWNRIFLAESFIYVLCLRTTAVWHCMVTINTFWVELSWFELSWAELSWQAGGRPTTVITLKLHFNFDQFGIQDPAFPVRTTSFTLTEKILRYITVLRVLMLTRGLISD